MRTLPLIGAISVVTLAAAAFAMPAMHASKMDTDGNGSVSKAEAMTAADSMFAKMDDNGDGTLNAADHEAKMKSHFQTMDADKNGAISEAEFAAAHKARMEMRDDKMDGRGRHGGHHGGKGGGGMMLLKAADTNADMAVSKAEFRASAEAHFAKADSNKDGALSATEQQAARKAMREMRDDMPLPAPGA